MDGENPLHALAARKYAADFREAAARWREAVKAFAECESDADQGRLAGALSELGTECGRLVIEAAELGYLPEIPGLRGRIDWHTGDGTQVRKPGMHVVYVRCPHNLFHELAGGHLVRVRNEGGRPVVIEDQWRGTPRHGGIIPEARPATLRMTEGARKAAACEMIADLIERHAARAPDWIVCTQADVLEAFDLPRGSKRAGFVAEKHARGELVLAGKVGKVGNRFKVKVRIVDPERHERLRRIAYPDSTRGIIS